MPNKFTYHSKYGTYEDCYFRVSHYVSNDRIAIQIWNNEDGAIADVTVNVDEPLAKNEIAVKDYSENEGMLKEMMRIGLVTQVKRFIHSGFVQIPICEYNEKLL